MQFSKQQIYELKWFCKNVTGTRQEFYELLDKMNEFKAKLDRLMKTCDAVDTYCKAKGINIYEDPDKQMKEAFKKFRKDVSEGQATSTGAKP